MAIENGTVRGYIATRTVQLGSGKLFTEGELFEQGFDGQFTGIVVPPLFIAFDVTEGEEPVQSAHATCGFAGGLAGQTLLYGPRPITRPINVSSTICSIGGSASPVGISYVAGESPVQVSVPPCGPLPFVFWTAEAVPVSPFNLGPATVGGWSGQTFGFRGAQLL